MSQKSTKKVKYSAKGTPTSFHLPAKINPQPKYNLKCLERV